MVGAPRGVSAYVQDCGRTLVRFRAVDYAQNWSDWTTPDADSTAVVDYVAPRITMAGPVPTGDHLVVSAAATDPTSGVAGLVHEISTDYGATWSAPAPGATVHLDTLGYYRVRFEATDVAGNSTGWVEPIVGFVVQQPSPG